MKWFGRKKKQEQKEQKEQEELIAVKVQDAPSISTPDLESGPAQETPLDQQTQDQSQVVAPKQADLAPSAENIQTEPCKTSDDKTPVQQEIEHDQLQEPLTKDAIEEKVQEQIEPEPVLADEKSDVPPDQVELETEKKRGFFSRLMQGLSKTSSAICAPVMDLLHGKKKLDEDALEELETILLQADLGVELSEHLIESIVEASKRADLENRDYLFEHLKKELLALVEPLAQPLHISPTDAGPFVILMVGVNGAGKTTTIGKLCKKLQQSGHSVLVAAGDTFRAAAIEQLQSWAQKNKVECVAQHTGADSASVIYDAIDRAKAKKIDVVIADTAGRLHTKDHLMAELEKVVRVCKKHQDTMPQEIMLVVDASMGQNALLQAETFHQSVGLNGISITKLDGTAKGGILFAIAHKLSIPVRYIGIGEKLDDLAPFDAEAFVEALFHVRDEKTTIAP